MCIIHGILFYMCMFLLICIDIYIHLFLLIRLINFNQFKMLSISNAIVWLIGGIPKVGHTSNSCKMVAHMYEDVWSLRSLCWRLTACLVLLCPTLGSYVFQSHPYLAADVLALQHEMIWLFPHLVLPQCNIRALPRLASQSRTGFYAVCSMSFYFVCLYFASS